MPVHPHLLPVRRLPGPVPARGLPRLGRQVRPGGRGAEGEGGDGARRPHTRLPTACTRSLGAGAVTDSRAVTSVCRATSVAGVETRTTPRWAGEGAGSGRGRGGSLPTLILTASLFLCPLAFFSVLPPSLSLFSPSQLFPCFCDLFPLILPSVFFLLIFVFLFCLPLSISWPPLLSFKIVFAWLPWVFLSLSSISLSVCLHIHLCVSLVYLLSPCPCFSVSLLTVPLHPNCLLQPPSLQLPPGGLLRASEWGELLPVGRGGPGAVCGPPRPLGICPLSRCGRVPPGPGAVPPAGDLPEHTPQL